MKKIKAAFFDRDGTIIKDVSYLSNIFQVEIIPGVIEFCLDLQKQGYTLFVVTNQSGVARGFFTESFVTETHKYINKLFEEKGVFFKKWYLCPHHPEFGGKIDCDCRKPKPGMLLTAAKEHNIDLTKSLMIGDALRDQQAGEAAGCKSIYIQDVAGDFDLM
jgi:D-glycero-D-manno-heptose 1,7-bisphosphate phosphatase